MKLLVDGVAFQGDYHGFGVPIRTGEFWTVLIRFLAKIPDLDILLLDRGGAPLDGVDTIPFPSHDGRYAAADSALLQKVGDHFAVDAFVSTGWTTPLHLPSLLVVEKSDGCERRPPEAELACAFARRTITVELFGREAAASTLVAEVCAHLAAMVDLYRAGAYDDLFDRWSRLRLLQVLVEV